MTKIEHLQFLVLMIPTFLILVAAAVSPLLPGRMRALRVLWVAVVAMVLESVALLGLFVLWLAGPLSPNVSPSFPE
jgi:hypothetical protein